MLLLDDVLITLDDQQCHAFEQQSSVFESIIYFITSFIVNCKYYELVLFLGSLQHRESVWISNKFFQRNPRYQYHLPKYFSCSKICKYELEIVNLRSRSTNQPSIHTTFLNEKTPKYLHEVKYKYKGRFRGTSEYS